MDPDHAYDPSQVAQVIGFPESLHACYDRTYPGRKPKDPKEERMLPLHTQQVLSDLERDLRRKAEHQRRLRTERTRDDQFGMDAEIRVLVERGLQEAPCSECEDELSHAAG
jgi:hypothetical protein